MRDSAVPIQRLLTLRQQPGFADVDLSELATMAENLSETVFAAGAVIARPGHRVPAIHIVVDGRLETSTRSWGPRQAFGVLEVFAGRAVAEPVHANVETHTLQLAGADLVEILEDNWNLLSNTRRGIARHLLAHHAAPWTRRGEIIATRAHTGLVERLMVLRQQLPFARMQALAALAQVATEQTWQAGETLCAAGDFADGAYAILDGAVRVREEALVPNDMLGMLETLAEREHQATSVAITPVRALRVSAAALIDVMEDHTDFALAIVRRLAGEVLDQPAETVN